MSTPKARVTFSVEPLSTEAQMVGGYTAPAGNPESEGYISKGSEAWSMLPKGCTAEERRWHGMVERLYEETWKSGMQEAREANLKTFDVDLFDRGSFEKIAFYDACIRFAKHKGLSFFVAKIPRTDAGPERFILTIRL